MAFDAIEHVKNNLVDVVLLDGNNDPGITGLETLARIKLKINQQVPVVLITKNETGRHLSG